MSSPSWIEGLGGPEEIREEMKKIARYILDAYNLPYDPRNLNAQSTNNEVKCCYKILDPNYQTFINCNEFRKKIKFTIEFFHKLGEEFMNFTINDFHDHLRDNTEMIRLIDIERFNKENRKAELFLLAFNLEFRRVYLDSIPEIPSAYIEQVNDTKNEINTLLDTNISLDRKIECFMLLLYFIDIVLDNHNIDRITSSVFMIMCDILNDLNEKIDQIIQHVPNSPILMNLKLKIIEKSNLLLAESRNIYRQFSPNVSSFKDVSTHDYSSSSFKESKFEPSKIYEKCENVFKDLTTTDGKKFKLICHRLVDPKYCKDINQIRHNIYDYYSKQYPKIVDETETLEVDTAHIVQSVFKSWIDFDANYSQAESLFERSIFQENGFIVIQDGFEGAGEGVTRNTFDLLAKALKTEKVFIPLDEDSKRYTINYDYKVNIGIDEVPYERGRKSIQLLFWNFIGEFLQFCIVNNITLDFYLSYNLLYVLLVYDVDKINKHNLITYYLLDNNNTETRFMIESIKTPAHIEEYFENFNSYKKIVAKDKVITQRNFLEYLEMKARYQLNNETYNKKYVFSSKLSELIMGFQLLKYTKMYRILAKYKVNVQTLDRLLSESNVTIDNLKKFTESIFYLPSGNGVPLLYCETGMKHIISYDTHGNKTEEPNPKYNPEHKKIFENFKRIIASGARTFPIDLAAAKSSSDSAESSGAKRRRSEEYLRFAKRLFHFWSASSAITFMPPAPYKVVIINRTGSLPTTHTCFYTIDIPDDLTSYKELYKKLVIAVNNVEDELGLL